MKIIDMHCDTISLLLEQKRQGKPVSLLENQGHLDLKRLKKSGYLLQNFALFVNSGRVSDPWDEACALHALYVEELEKNVDWIAPVLCYEDIVKNERQGKLSALLTVEEGAVCKGEIEKLRQLYEMGVRMMTLTWNYPNEIGYPNLNRANREKEDFLYIPDTEHGLTECGREMVATMEELGMIVDVSHLSDAGFGDVAECTRKPFVASHSNARNVCRCVRNLTDDMLRKLAERGGCVGLNFYPDFLTEVPKGMENPGTINSIVEHAKYIVSVAGIEVLGLGSDFDGIEGHEELQGAQGMNRLWDAMYKAGFSQRQLDKIFYQNVLRVYREVLG
ncbi:MAG: dipeptidase [Eubacterium sp.]|nr:dipeptidase [Eubacterium sp.]